MALEAAETRQGAVEPQRLDQDVEKGILAGSKPKTESPMAAGPDEIITDGPPRTTKPKQGEDNSDAASIGNQGGLVLSRSRLVVAFFALAVALFVSFIDQTSVSTSIPAISADLDTGSATSWIGSSFLIASTSFQLINGRLSDIFGRKNCLLVCLALIGLGDLLCGFAKTKEQLFAFRAVAGVGGGGVNSVVLIIVSDITTMENRGKYQGILGAVLVCANGIGPFLGGVVVEKATWRWVFWMVPMLAIPVAIVILLCLPLKFEPGNYREKAKKVDYGGVVLNLASVILILIPLSGGGSTYRWSSAFFIAMFTVGIVLAVLFVLYEWKLAPIPIMPLRLFIAPHCWALYAASFLLSICYYGNFFYLPLYFQSVLHYSALESGALILPLVISTSMASIAVGQFMARVGRYMPPIACGFGLATLGTGLACRFDRSTPLWYLIVVLLVQGVGMGMTLQTSLVGLQVNSNSADRAVVTGLRNFLRTIGGAFGLTASGVILSNTLNTKLSGSMFLSNDMLASLSSSTLALDEFHLDAAQKDEVLNVYMEGPHYLFVFYTVCAGANFLLSWWVGNTDLHLEKKAKAAAEQPADSDQAHQEEQGARHGQDAKI